MGSTYLEDILGNNYIEVRTFLFPFLLFFLVYLRMTLTPKEGEKIIALMIVRITKRDIDHLKRSI
jgi:hypothetical protein